MSKRLLFAGISTMRDHAGQHKLYFIADTLGRRGIPVSVVVPDRTENRAFLAERPHIDAHFYPSGTVWSDLRHRSLLLDRGAWSAIWVVGVGLRSLVVRCGRARRVPVIKDFDEFPSMIESFGAPRRAYLRWMERRMIAGADGFTCASAFLEQAVRRRRPELGDRLLRLPVAISEDEHQVDPAVVARLRSEAAGRPVLLYVGSVNRFYTEQLDEIIALARVLRRRGSAARVRVLGGGPDLEFFRAKARDATVGTTLEFAGHVDRRELASHMEAAAALIFPFPANPFNLSRCPTKAYHYAASGRPVVTNRTGEVAALLGDAALYYPEHDVEALADRCMEAIRVGARPGPSVGLAELTWETRAETFARWLAVRGWLPAMAGVPV